MARYINIVSKEIIVDFYKFLKFPNYWKFEDGSYKFKWLVFMTLTVLNIAFHILIVLPIDLIVEKFIPVKSIFVLSEFSFYTFSFMLLILAPIIEEIIFRSWLRYNMLVKSIFSLDKWKIYFPYLVYFSTIAFGFIHLSNFDNNQSLFYILSPLLILSQCFGGFLMAYLRIRLSFLWGISFHMFWNFLVLLLMLFGAMTNNVFKHNTDDYKFEVFYSLFKNGKKQKVLTIEEIDDKLISVVVKQNTTQVLLDTLYGKNVYYVNDVLIDLNFISENGITRDSFLSILKKDQDIKDFR